MIDISAGKSVGKSLPVAIEKAINLKNQSVVMMADKYLGLVWLMGKVLEIVYIIFLRFQVQ